MEALSQAASFCAATKGRGKKREKPQVEQLSFEDYLFVSAQEAFKSAAPSPPAVVLSEIEEPAKRFYRIGEGEIGGRAAQKERFRWNVEAINLLKKLEAEDNRDATADEQAVLVKYVGWGGVPQAFHYSKDWQEEYDLLEKLLTEEEYESARASTPNAHYTSPEVIRFMYEVVLRMGFKGGRIIEPALGIGHFLGLMSSNLVAQSKVTGVELDSLSGRIARKLYPDADIRIAGFESTKLPDNFFDLAISNVPFGDYKVHDPRYTKYKFSIHDYFFAKSLDLVKPGGIVAFVTSRYTMDKKDVLMRDYIHDRADFLGAVRLPNTAFRDIANTEVTADVILLQRRQAGEIPKGQAWIATKAQMIGDDEAFINEYFVENTQMMLGTLAMKSGMYGRYDVSLESDGRDIAEALKEKVSSFPEQIFVPDISVASTRVEVQQNAPVPDHVKEGAFIVVDGKLYTNAGGQLLLMDLSSNKMRRIEKMIGLRDAVRELLYDEMRTNDEASVSMRRAYLNSVYDYFVKKFGFVHARDNRAAFSDDPDYPLLLSLEHWDEDRKTSTKADIFTKRVIHPVKKVEKVETVKEAFLVTLNELGLVDFRRMSQLCGKDESEIQTELEGIIFKNPQGGWETADEYLSGNVKEKLQVAESAAQVDVEFQKNVEALKAVQPKDLDFSEIHVNLGAPWIPPLDIEKFINELLEIPEACTVAYAPVIGTWAISIGFKKRWAVQESVNNTKTWGTSRCDSITLMEDALNNRIPSVRDAVDDKFVVNVKETEAAREKLYLIKEHFRKWVWQDAERRTRLVQLYNDKFNNLRARKFDGSHLTLPGMTSHITLNPHQKDAVWRIIQTGNTLLAHVVGSGKAQPLDAKVLTPTGWRLMGGIKAGDQVISINGKPTLVKAVFPQGEKDIFRVSFSDGASTECCDEHLWMTHTYRERSYAQRAIKMGKDWNCGKGKVRELSEIRTTLVADHLCAKNHSIPIVQPVQFQHREVPISPYLLGVLLGDGGLTSTQMSITSADEEIIARCAELLPPDMKLGRVSTGDRCPAWTITNKNPHRNKPNLIRKALSDLQLSGLSSSEKFIPDDYLFNDVESRIELLRGLMDTDGYVGKKGLSTNFYTTSSRLAEGVVALIQSLGGIARVNKRCGRYKYNGEMRTGKICFVLSVAMPPKINPFHLSRKVNAVIPKTSYAPARYIVDVTPMGRKQAQCILVEDPSHLYVTDDFIVTHNTYVCVAAAMEMKRLGLVTKPLITVPNHLLEQWAAEFLRLYPLANVLIARVEDLSPLKRKAFMAKVATNNWDAVIVAHTSFEKLPMSKEAVAMHIRRQIEELEKAILEAEDGRDSGIVKRLEKAKKRLEAKLKDRMNEEKKDDCLTFEELGVDMVLVDEADLFKNLFFATKMTRVAGLPNSESQRAFDMYVKSQWCFFRRYPVVFGTGTPVSNTMAEIFTMQRYLQPDKLEEYGIQHFDSWAQNFGEAVTSLEIAPDGSGYRMRTRFARFINIPELMQIFRLVADVQTDEMLNLEKPVLKDGKPIVVTAPASHTQKAYVESLVKRAEIIRGGHIDPRIDNMLKITTDGRKAALDMRLIASTSTDEEMSKVNEAVRRIYDVWESTAESKITQLVFCDMSTPHAEHFNLYGDMRDKLVNMGIPKEEIAFIHDADTDLKKKSLFVKVNFGRTRILFGSTAKMGAGTNVQRLLGALHHLDAPWRPRDIQQREGRILRQGNKHKEVSIFRYVTEGSFDAYMWQTIEAKARFIAQIMTDKITARSAEDIEGVVLSYAEVKALASGNPLVMEKFKVDIEVNRLETLYSQHQQEKWRMEYDYAALPGRVETQRKYLERLEKDLSIRVMLSEFSMEIDGTVYSERKAAGDAIIRQAHFLRGMDRYEQIGSYCGFDLYIKSYALGHLAPSIIARGAAEHTGTVSDSEVGTIASLDHALRNMERQISDIGNSLEQMEKKYGKLAEELAKPFPHEEKLRELLKKQYEINKELDLDKSERTSGVEGGDEEMPKAA